MLSSAMSLTTGISSTYASAWLAYCWKLYMKRTEQHSKRIFTLFSIAKMAKCRKRNAKTEDIHLKIWLTNHQNKKNWKAVTLTAIAVELYLTMHTDDNVFTVYLSCVVTCSAAISLSTGEVNVTKFHCHYVRVCIATDMHIREPLNRLTSKTELNW